MKHVHEQGPDKRVELLAPTSAAEAKAEHREASLRRYRDLPLSERLRISLTMVARRPSRDVERR